MKKFTKGFTLIELLVVIAIVGLLTSVALASLNSARKKAADSTIKQNLTQIRRQAEIVFDNSPSDVGYQNLFVANSPAANMYNAALITTGACTVSVCGGFWANEPNPGGETAVTSWMAWVALRTDQTQAWCVDYKGVSKEIANPGSTMTLAPYSCP